MFIDLWWMLYIVCIYCTPDSIRIYSDQTTLNLKPKKYRLQQKTERDYSNWANMLL